MLIESQALPVDGMTPDWQFIHVCFIESTLGFDSVILVDWTPNLPPQRQEPNDVIWTTASFHQLHLAGFV